MPSGIETVLNETSGLAKRIYDNTVVDQEQRLTITYDSLPTKNWKPSGDGWYGDAHLIRAGGFKFQFPTEALPQNTYEVNQQFRIRTTEHVSTITFTKDFLIKLVGGQTSFEDYMYKVEDSIRSCKKNMNQGCYIGPVMARTALTAPTVATNTLTVASTQYLFVGQYLDCYTAADAPVFNNVQITNIVGLTVTLGSNVSASATDILYNHDENAGGGDKGFIGLPSQADDGTDFNPVFENLSRTTYPAWRGNRIDAGSAPLTNDLLQKLQNQIRQNGGNDYMTEDYVNYVHLNSVRRYISIILPQKRYIDASKYDSGMEKPNMLEWNGKPIIIDPDAPLNGWIMYNRNHGGKMELAPLAEESVLGGTTMKWNAGYTQGVVVTYFNGQLGTNKPSANGILVNLASVS